MLIESNRLLLTEITWDDIENIHALHSIPEVDEFNTLGLPKNIEETREVMRPIIEEPRSAKRHHISWKIETKDALDFIGLAGMVLSAEKYRQGEIYYKLLPACWGNGYATEVSKALIKSGFEDFKLHIVGAGVATKNIQSIKVLEKSGMTREGLRRKVLPIRGEWVDNYEYAILEDDPREF
jgi:ribosomal-protein-alanine N-acetyltransferase